MFDALMETLSQGATGVLLTGLALIFMFLGLIRMNGALMAVAAVFTVPYTYTSGDWSSLLLLVRLLPLTQLVSAYLISQEESQPAWIVAAPTLVTLIYSFYDILVQQQALQGLINMSR